MLDSRYGVLGVKDITFSPPIILAKQLSICFILPQIFAPEGFTLSMWSAANFSWALRCCIWNKILFISSSLSAHVDVKHAWRRTWTPAVFIGDCFWLTLDRPNHFSRSSCFFSCWLWQWHNCAMHFILINSCCTVDLGNCNCFGSEWLSWLSSWMWCSFRSTLFSVDFPTVVFVAESNAWIKQALLKWTQKSHPLLSIWITQRKLRGHVSKQIWFKQLIKITKMYGKMYSMYIFESADLVTFSEDLL